MKRTEKKVRDEISEIILHHKGRGKIGTVEIDEAKNNIIYCSCYGSIFLSLDRDSKKVMVRPIGKGLTQLRWLLKQLKR
jgi:hypothetical protein